MCEGLTFSRFENRGTTVVAIFHLAGGFAGRYPEVVFYRRSLEKRVADLKASGLDCNESERVLASWPQHGRWGRGMQIVALSALVIATAALVHASRRWDTDCCLMMCICAACTGP
jgi:hypothetical protein